MCVLQGHDDLTMNETRRVTHLTVHTWIEKIKQSVFGTVVYEFITVEADGALCVEHLYYLLISNKNESLKWCNRLRFFLFLLYFYSLVFNKYWNQHAQKFGDHSLFCFASEKVWTEHALQDLPRKQSDDGSKTPGSTLTTCSAASLNPCPEGSHKSDTVRQSLPLSASTVGTPKRNRETRNTNHCGKNKMARMGTLRLHPRPCPNRKGSQAWADDVLKFSGN